MTKKEAIEYLRVSAQRPWECGGPVPEHFQQHNHRVEACLERLCPNSSPLACPTVTKPRPRNDLLDALVSLDGANPLEVTRVAFGAAATALRDILEVMPDASVPEILRRAANYRLHFHGMPCTATAMAKNWGQCSSPPQRQAKPVNIGILLARRNAVKEKIGRHACNPESMKYTGNPSETERAEYKQLKITSRELCDRIAATET